MNKNSLSIVISLLTIAVLYTNCSNFESITGNSSQTGSVINPEMPPTSSTADTNTAPITPLTITRLDVSEISANTATISWDLTENSTGQIEFGLTEDLEETSKKEESFRWAKHVQTLKNLEPSAEYYFRIRSEDAAGNSVVSDVETFTTGKATSTPSVTTPTPPMVPQPGSWPAKADGDLPMAGIFYGNYTPGVGAQNAGIAVESSRRFRAEKTGALSHVGYHNRNFKQS